ncbi:hypothetical protein CYMTET_35707 [Cymbomonas tetramitiformis]|uniref:Uncharacterized protein n=1 Tax=Cymbomonas tetramitiformis TaxID=36881 RepID=A0AAE0KNT4_9CHLO|nr:hypothetical protein CYMTET_35707 [Cymbomonas tetramitiformis]|eukprot:gene262-477_t
MSLADTLPNCKFFDDTQRHSQNTFIASSIEWTILRRIAQDDELTVRFELLQRSPARLSEIEIEQAVTHGSMEVLYMYFEEFDENFRFCPVLAEMALTNGNFAVFKWGVRKTMDAALLIETTGGKRKHADMQDPKWKAWFDALAYMTVVAARAGQTEALSWMLTGAYKEYFRNPFPEFCLYTEAVSNMQWETVRFLLDHKAEGISSRDTRRTLLTHAELTFLGEELHAATLVLESAFEQHDTENADIRISGEDVPPHRAAHA